MEDSTSSQTSVLNCASSTSVQNVVFRCEYLFDYSSKMIDSGGTFSVAHLCLYLPNLLLPN